MTMYKDTTLSLNVCMYVRTVYCKTVNAVEKQEKRCNHIIIQTHTHMHTCTTISPLTYHMLVCVRVCVCF